MALEFALAGFVGEREAIDRFADIQGKPAATAPWVREVGFVEHRQNGRLRLLGTFAGHYVDVDETDHMSEAGAAEGTVAGGLIGGLLGPPGLAVGLVLGAIIGSQARTPGQTESEPQPLGDQLRLLVPRSHSAMVIIADADDAQEMLTALDDSPRWVVRAPLDARHEAALQESLRSTPLASPAGAVSR